MQTSDESSEIATNYYFTYDNLGRPGQEKKKDSASNQAYRWTYLYDDLENRTEWNKYNSSDSFPKEFQKCGRNLVGYWFNSFPRPTRARKRIRERTQTGHKPRTDN